MATDAPPASLTRRGVSHKAQRSESCLDSQPGPTSSSEWRQGKSSGPRLRKSRRRTDKQRGGASDAIPNRDSSNGAAAIRSRHLRNLQPPSPAGDPPHAPHVSASTFASLPPSSPATDLRRRTQVTASVATDWRSRRPFAIDSDRPTTTRVLANRPAAQDHSEDDAIMEAIERSEAALGPARCRFERVCDLEDGRSFELYWQAQAARSRLAAADAEARTEGEARLGLGLRLGLVHGFLVSAERSTAWWPGDGDADSPPSGEDSSPSVGAPQHTNVHARTVAPVSDRESTSRAVWWQDATYRGP